MKGRWKSVKKNSIDFMFLLPAALVFLFVIAVPFFQAFGIAFTNWNGLSKEYDFVGLKNLTALFHDTQTINAVSNTMEYTVITCIGVNILALAITVGLNLNVAGNRFLKSAMFLPIIASLVITAFIWQRIYGDVFPVNFGIVSPLTRLNTVIPGIALMCLWRDTGWPW